MNDYNLLEKIILRRKIGMASLKLDWIGRSEIHQGTGASFEF